MTYAKRIEKLEMENQELRAKNEKYLSLNNKTISPKYWILIFYKSSGYRMAKIVEYGMDAAIIKAKKEDPELEHYNLWWWNYETYADIKDKFKPFAS